LENEHGGVYDIFEASLLLCEMRGARDPQLVRPAWSAIERKGKRIAAIARGDGPAADVFPTN